MEKKDMTVLWSDRKHHLWFPLSFTKYEVKNDRLMISQGLLSTTVEETLLYRVVDIRMKQTLAGKIFGTGDIVLTTRVDATSEITLKNIARPSAVRELLSEAIEESRDRRNVVGKEFYAGDGMHADLDGDGFCDLGNDN